MTSIMKSKGIIIVHRVKKDSYMVRKFRILSHDFILYIYIYIYLQVHLKWSDPYTKTHIRHMNIIKVQHYSYLLKFDI